MSLLRGLANVHSILTILAIYLCHIYKFKVVGFLVDYDVNSSSTLFVLSFAMLIAEYKLWPITLKRPPCALLMLYEMLMAALLANVARTLVWIPAIVSIHEYLPVMTKKITQLNSRLKLRKYGILYQFSRWLDSDCGLSALSQLFAVAVFILVLYTTDTLDHIWELFLKVQCKFLRAACATVCEPPRRTGGMCGQPSRRDDQGGENVRATMSYSNASGDAISGRDDLDSDSDEVLPPPMPSVTSDS